MRNEKCSELDRLEREIKHLREHLYLYHSQPDLSKQSIVYLSEKLDRKIIQFMKISNKQTPSI